MLWKLNVEISLIFPVIEAPFATCYKEVMYARTGPPEYPILSKSIANSSRKRHSNEEVQGSSILALPFSIAYYG